MKPRRSVLAVGGGMMVLAAAAMLDMVRVTPGAELAQRGDRLDVAEQASRCGVVSMIAACADDAFSDLQRARTAKGSMLQVFEKPGQTILVKVKLGD
jgi:hypothetical protein